MNKEQSINVRERRLLAPVPVCKNKQLFDLPVSFATDGFRGLMLEWIADYTVGEFYLSSTVLYFCEAQDAMSYKLYDARKKCEEQTALKKQQQTEEKLQDIADKLTAAHIHYKTHCGRLK